ncbi:hypothetical protein [Enterobacter roggenkampii]|uniref:hypothetical protein n=1 Tax=Enterobacter roggenkampii TaxID=1812935 RepID=UPI000A62B152|nr:hypothetical protein [Enterobacter roggenkampii]
MSFEIPECEDLEWQQEMLRQLRDRLSTLKDGFEEMKQDALDEAISIVDALQEYSGY